MKKRALIIVAHPDDETIWMGGTILRNKNWDWTIFSLCRKSDEDRMPKFKKVCNFYGANYIIEDIEDETLVSLPRKHFTEVIEKNLNKKSFDFIFTHGENGEYGHKRHTELHDAVLFLTKEKKLRCKNLYVFSYEKKGERMFAKTSGDLVINLTKQEHEAKIKVIKNVYGFSDDSFEVESCGERETFVQLQ